MWDWQWGKGDIFRLAGSGAGEAVGVGALRCSRPGQGATRALGLRRSRYPSGVFADRVRRLMRRGAGSGTSPYQSALLVAVPEAESLVRRLEGSAAAGDGLPPHVTVLFPFLSPEVIEVGTLDALRDLFQAHEAFAFNLTGVDTFPGVVWLAPEPGEPFVALTRSVSAQWPDLVPYGDPSLDSVAHLTVARGRLKRSWRATIDAALPIAARATEVLLMSQESGGVWAVRARFPLGGG